SATHRRPWPLVSCAALTHPTNAETLVRWARPGPPQTRARIDAETDRRPPRRDHALLPADQDADAAEVRPRDHDRGDLRPGAHGGRRRPGTDRGGLGRDAAQRPVGLAERALVRGAAPGPQAVHRTPRRGLGAVRDLGAPDRGGRRV